MPCVARAETVAFSLMVGPATITLRSDGAATPIWQLAGGPPVLRARQGDELRIALGNALAVPVQLHTYGVDGVALPAPIAAGNTATFALPLRQAGTMLLDPRVLSDAAERPCRPRVLVVEETEPLAADRDDVLLIEQWRLRADNTAVAPGNDPKDTTAVFTGNGQALAEFALRPNARLRLRIVNSCERFPIGLRIADLDVRVMAIDGRPAEPFPARDGQLVLAPGSRADVLIDVSGTAGQTTPIMLFAGGPPIQIGRIIASGEPLRATPLAGANALPSTGLPTRLPFQNAIRAEIAFDGSSTNGWTSAANIFSGPPVFKAKRARVVMLTVVNKTATPVRMRLHGHHARLLDRLDDGWKPYWIDTLLLDTGQTQRIAFLADTPGQWLIEAVQASWSARKLTRWFAVE